MKSILMTTVLILCSSVFAAEQPPMDAKMQAAMKKMMEAGTPGPEHKKLSEMAGNWNYTTKMWHKADATPEESTGTSTIKMVLGGRWMQQEFKGTAMGMPFEGMGFTGYNNVTKKYESIWLDTMSTGGMYGKGTMDVATNTLKDTSKYVCPMDGKERTARTEWKIVDNNNMSFTMFGKGMSGKEKEFKEMEIVYKRK